MIRRWIVLMLIAVSAGACGSGGKPRPEDRQVLKLWEGQAPGQQGETEKDIPVIQAYWPKDDRATGAAMVVCPGGGYAGLANHEGPVVGEWLAENGIAAFVLRYRLGPKYHHPVQLGDAQRAIRYVRANAKDWEIDPRQIGILGFSAGGHLASSAATHYTPGDRKAPDKIERVSSRPDVQVLIYPVITMGDKTHAGSKRNLLGEQPPAELVELMSNEKQVTEKTPPCFIVHPPGDKAVPIENADMYVEALKKNGVKVEYIRQEIGPHGFGLKPEWTGRCIEWLRGLGF
jgi:acetyl esterase/lipase